MAEGAALLAPPAATEGAVDHGSRRVVRRVAAGLVAASGACGLAAWLRAGPAAPQLHHLVDLPGHSAAALIEAYDEAQVAAACTENFRGQPCCWTKAWSCPGQEPGKKGSAVNDGTMAYHCCCQQGLFESAADCAAELLPNTIRLPSDKDLWGEERAAPEVGSCKEEVGKQLRGEFSPADEPRLCKIPVEEYPKHDEVAALCREKSRWEDLAKIIQPRRCEVDPETGLMACSRDDWCHGGQYVAERYPKLTKNLTYDCGTACQGTLLLACCETCTSSQGSAAKWGVDNVVCKGCDVPSLQAAARQSSDCTVKDGMFHCESTATCTAGEPTESCEEVHHTCDVFPCDRCDVPHLQAQCCADCLSMMCSGVPERRLMCQGCEHAPGDDAWWQKLR